MAKRIVRLSDIFNSEMLSYYRDNPIAFIEDVVFHGEKDESGKPYYLSEQQKAVARSFVTNEKISIRSGRGIGKTIIISLMILWFQCTRSSPRVVITAPTFRQLSDNLWAELSRWHKLSLVRDVFEWTASKFYLKENPAVWFASYLTASSPESIQGPHRKNLLLIVDEASGVKDEFYNTLAGSATEEGNIIALFGNPTQTAGFFADTHCNPKVSAKWKNFKFSSLDSPFVDKDWVEEIKDRYGEHSDIYRVHVLGEFPSGSPEAFISLETVEKATMRDIEPSGDIQIGVDVARFGNDLTCLCWRHGNKVYPLITKEKTSIPDVVGMVINLVKQIRLDTKLDSIIKICVDDTGVGGGVSDELALDRDHNIEVVPINFGSRSSDDMYELMTSYLWGNVKTNINNISLPKDDKLIAELSNRRYKITKTGKIRIEPKDEYKKEYKQSPDRADALILAFCHKKNDAVVLKNFDHLNSNYVRNITGFEVSTGEKYVSIFYSKNKTLHTLVSKWSNNKLFVLDEISTDDSVDVIVPYLKSNQPCYKMIGNGRMFNGTTDDISSEFRKHCLSVMENYRYDKFGSIQTLESIVNQKRIIIDPRCKGLIEQLRKWNLSKNEKELEKEYGLAYSLCLIVSELKEKIDYIPSPVYYESYTKEKERDIKESISGPKENIKWFLS